MTEVKQSDWPASVLKYTRQMGLECNPLKAKVISLSRGHGHLVSIQVVRAGGEEGIESTDSWGRVGAFLMALVRLGVKPETVIDSLRTCVPEEK